MVICFDCPQHTKDILDRLVLNGGYKDYSQVVISALDNLNVLQDQVFERGSVVIEDAPAGLHHKRESVTISTRLPSSKETRRKLLQLEGLPEVPASVGTVPAEEAVPGKVVPLNQWLFGQYNKILPAKVSCRALANLLVNEPKGVLLKDVAERIGDEARLLGERLRLYDREHSVERDDALATGFPVGDSPWTRSSAVARYANHFVGHLSKGKLAGLLADLKLLGEHGEDGRVLLTKAGWQFAAMPNPVLEEQQEQPRQKFSPEEVAFLLKHIVELVHRERFAYCAILRGLKDGAYTPDSLDKALQSACPSSEGGPYSRAFLKSQRSGAVSRMADLGLISRIRNATKVTYNVLKAGNNFLDSSCS